MEIEALGGFAKSDGFIWHGGAYHYISSIGIVCWICSQPSRPFFLTDLHSPHLLALTRTPLASNSSVGVDDLVQFGGADKIIIRQTINLMGGVGY